MPTQISYVSIGVADMAAVRALWVEQFGLEVRGQRMGADPALAEVWDIPSGQITEQLLLGTPGATTGLLHFVQFAEPGEAVRFNAASTDLGAKNVDVNCTDLPALVERLKAAGYLFRSAIGEYEIDDILAREVQMPVHDGLNVVLIEVMSAGYEVELTAQGFAGLTSFVVIVPDVAVETAFYKSVFQLDEVLQHKLSGPALEMAAALPKGTVLDLHLLGEAGNLFGRVELIEYVGISGLNRFTRAVAPAAGILRVGFKVPDLAAFEHSLQTLGINIERSLNADLLTGSGRMLEFCSPAGLRLQVSRR